MRIIRERYTRWRVTSDIGGHVDRDTAEEAADLAQAWRDMGLIVSIEQREQVRSRKVPA